jgi:hypothetical protein
MSLKVPKNAQMQLFKEGYKVRSLLLLSVRHDVIQER